MAAGAGWSAATMLTRGHEMAGVPYRALVVVAGLSAAGVVYLAACSVLRVPEVKAVAETVRRIFGGRRG